MLFAESEDHELIQDFLFPSKVEEEGRMIKVTLEIKIPNIRIRC